MKILRVVFTEQIGEVEGIFDEDGNMLGTWDCNDVQFREEYYNPFLKKLGFKVVRKNDDKFLVKKLIEVWDH